MTRQELFQRLRDRGIAIKTWQLDKLQANGLMPPSDKAHKTQRVYTEAHLEFLESHLKKVT